MDLEVVYEVKRDYLDVKVNGQFSEQRARDALLEWVKKAREKGIDRVLYDITDVKGLDVDEISIFGQHLAADSFAKETAGLKVAVLLTARQLPKSEFITTVLWSRGVVATLTENRSDALTWLAIH